MKERMLKTYDGVDINVNDVVYVSLIDKDSLKVFRVIPCVISSIDYSSITLINTSSYTKNVLEVTTFHGKIHPIKDGSIITYITSDENWHEIQIAKFKLDSLMLKRGDIYHRIDSLKNDLVINDRKIEELELLIKTKQLEAHQRREGKNERI